jgi:hypothetical protein
MSKMKENPEIFSVSNKWQFANFSGRLHLEVTP